ncbi:MAG TPA: metal-dependent transcriptional regulator [Bacteroidales bacterium]|jgi:DtxR family Mn-dependent transcriptional regulator|nr:metal-dependent transcriptional regulator [Bacteroidales bacterium]
MTVSVENFVKVIYKQSQLSKADTRLSTIAGILNISNAAATDMARKLASRQLVNYTKYKPLTLADKGKELALKVLRKHRLWETFLYKTLNLSLHQIHIEAEQLEHLTSDYLANQIDHYLGSPLTDPHGDPIPAFNGQIETDQSHTQLSNAKAANHYTVARLSGSERDFFEFCTSNGLMIGSTLWVEKQISSPKMTEIKTNKKKILLHEDFTKLIFVKPAN